MSELGSERGSSGTEETADTDRTEIPGYFTDAFGDPNTISDDYAERVFKYIQEIIITPVLRDTLIAKLVSYFECDITVRGETLCELLIGEVQRPLVVSVLDVNLSIDAPIQRSAVVSDLLTELPSSLALSCLSDEFYYSFAIELLALCRGASREYTNIRFLQALKSPSTSFKSKLAHMTGGVEIPLALLCTFQRSTMSELVFEKNKEYKYICRQILKGLDQELSFSKMGLKKEHVDKFVNKGYYEHLISLKRLGGGENHIIKILLDILLDHTLNQEVRFNAVFDFAKEFLTDNLDLESKASSAGIGTLQSYLLRISADPDEDLSAMASLCLKEMTLLLSTNRAQRVCSSVRAKLSDVLTSVNNYICRNRDRKADTKCYHFASLLTTKSLDPKGMFEISVRMKGLIAEVIVMESEEQCGFRYSDESEREKFSTIVNKVPDLSCAINSYTSRVYESVIVRNLGLALLNTRSSEVVPLKDLTDEGDLSPEEALRDKDLYEDTAEGWYLREIVIITVAEVKHWANVSSVRARTERMLTSLENAITSEKKKVFVRPVAFVMDFNTLREKYPEHEMISELRKIRGINFNLNRESGTEANVGAFNRVQGERMRDIPKVEEPRCPREIIDKFLDLHDVDDTGRLLLENVELSFREASASSEIELRDYIERVIREAGDEALRDGTSLWLHRSKISKTDIQRAAYIKQVRALIEKKVERKLSQGSKDRIALKEMTVHTKADRRKYSLLERSASTKPRSKGDTKRETDRLMKVFKGSSLDLWELSPPTPVSDMEYVDIYNNPENLALKLHEYGNWKEENLEARRQKSDQELRDGILNPLFEYEIIASDGIYHQFPYILGPVQTDRVKPASLSMHDIPPLRKVQLLETELRSSPVKMESTQFMALHLLYAYISIALGLNFYLGTGTDIVVLDYEEDVRRLKKEILKEMYWKEKKPPREEKEKEESEVREEEEDDEDCLLAVLEDDMDMGFPLTESNIFDLTGREKETEQLEAEGDTLKEPPLIQPTEKDKKRKRRKAQEIDDRLEDQRREEEANPILKREREERKRNIDKEAKIRLLKKLHVKLLRLVASEEKKNKSLTIDGKEINPDTAKEDILEKLKSLRSTGAYECKKCLEEFMKAHEVEVTDPEGEVEVGYSYDTHLDIAKSKNGVLGMVVKKLMPYSTMTEKDFVDEILLHKVGTDSYVGEHQLIPNDIQEWFKTYHEQMNGLSTFREGSMILTDSQLDAFKVKLSKASLPEEVHRLICSVNTYLSTSVYVQNLLFLSNIGHSALRCSESRNVHSKISYSTLNGIELFMASPRVWACGTAYRAVIKMQEAVLHSTKYSQRNHSGTEWSHTFRLGKRDAENIESAVEEFFYEFFHRVVREGLELTFIWPEDDRADWERVEELLRDCVSNSIDLVENSKLDMQARFAQIRFDLQYLSASHAEWARLAKKISTPLTKPCMHYKTRVQALSSTFNNNLFKKLVMSVEGVDRISCISPLNEGFIKDSRAFSSSFYITSLFKGDVANPRVAAAQCSEEPIIGRVLLDENREYGCESTIGGPFKDKRPLLKPYRKTATFDAKFVGALNELELRKLDIDNIPLNPRVGGKSLLSLSNSSHIITVPSLAFDAELLLSKFTTLEAQKSLFKLRRHVKEKSFLRAIGVRRVPKPKQVDYLLDGFGLDDEQIQKIKEKMNLGGQYKKLESLLELLHPSIQQDVTDIQEWYKRHFQSASKEEDNYTPQSDEDKYRTDQACDEVANSYNADYVRAKALAKVYTDHNELIPTSVKRNLSSCHNELAACTPLYLTGLLSRMYKLIPGLFTQVNKKKLPLATVIANLVKDSEFLKSLPKESQKLILNQNKEFTVILLELIFTKSEIVYIARCNAIRQFGLTGDPGPDASGVSDLRNYLFFEMMTTDFETNYALEMVNLTAQNPHAKSSDFFKMYKSLGKSILPRTIKDKVSLYLISVILDMTERSDILKIAEDFTHTTDKTRVGMACKEQLGGNRAIYLMDYRSKLLMYSSEKVAHQLNRNLPCEATHMKDAKYVAARRAQESLTEVHTHLKTTGDYLAEFPDPDVSMFDSDDDDTPEERDQKRRSRQEALDADERAEATREEWVGKDRDSGMNANKKRSKDEVNNEEEIYNIREQHDDREDMHPSWNFKRSSAYRSISDLEALVKSTFADNDHSRWGPQYRFIAMLMGQMRAMMMKGMEADTINFYLMAGLKQLLKDMELPFQATEKVASMAEASETVREKARKYFAPKIFDFILDMVKSGTMTFNDLGGMLPGFAHQTSSTGGVLAYQSILNCLEWSSLEESADAVAHLVSIGEGETPDDKRSSQMYVIRTVSKKTGLVTLQPYCYIDGCARLVTMKINYFQGSDDQKLDILFYGVLGSGVIPISPDTDYVDYIYSMVFQSSRKTGQIISEKSVLKTDIPFSEFYSVITTLRGPIFPYEKYIYPILKLQPTAGFEEFYQNHCSYAEAAWRDGASLVEIMVSSLLNHRRCMRESKIYAKRPAFCPICGKSVLKVPTEKEKRTKAKSSLMGSAVKYNMFLSKGVISQTEKEFLNLLEFRGHEEWSTEERRAYELLKKRISDFDIGLKEARSGVSTPSERLTPPIDESERTEKETKGRGERSYSKLSKGKYAKMKKKERMRAENQEDVQRRLIMETHKCEDEVERLYKDRIKGESEFCMLPCTLGGVPLLSPVSFLNKSPYNRIMYDFEISGVDYLNIRLFFELMAIDSIEEFQEKSKWFQLNKELALRRSFAISDKIVKMRKRIRDLKAKMDIDKRLKRAEKALDNSRSTSHKGEVLQASQIASSRGIERGGEGRNIAFHMWEKSIQSKCIMLKKDTVDYYLLDMSKYKSVDNIYFCNQKDLVDILRMRTSVYHKQPSMIREMMAFDIKEIEELDFSDSALSLKDMNDLWITNHKIHTEVSRPTTIEDPKMAIMYMLDPVLTRDNFGADTKLADKQGMDILATEFREQMEYLRILWKKLSGKYVLWDEAEKDSDMWERGKSYQSTFDSIISELHYQLSGKREPYTKTNVFSNFHEGKLDMQTLIGQKIFFSLTATSSYKQVRTRMVKGVFSNSRVYSIAAALAVFPEEQRIEVRHLMTLSPPHMQIFRNVLANSRGIKELMCLHFCGYEQSTIMHLIKAKLEREDQKISVSEKTLGSLKIMEAREGDLFAGVAHFTASRMIYSNSLDESVVENLISAAVHQGMYESSMKMSESLCNYPTFEDSSLSCVMPGGIPHITSLRSGGGNVKYVTHSFTGHADLHGFKRDKSTKYVLLLKGNRLRLNASSTDLEVQERTGDFTREGGYRRTVSSVDLNLESSVTELYMMAEMVCNQYVGEADFAVSGSVVWEEKMEGAYAYYMNELTKYGNLQACINLSARYRNTGLVLSVLHKSQTATIKSSLIDSQLLRTIEESKEELDQDLVLNFTDPIVGDTSWTEDRIIKERAKMDMDTTFISSYNKTIETIRAKSRSTNPLYMRSRQEDFKDSLVNIIKYHVYAALTETTPLLTDGSICPMDGQDLTVYFSENGFMHVFGEQTSAMEESCDRGLQNLYIDSHPGEMVPCILAEREYNRACIILGRDDLDNILLQHWGRLLYPLGMYKTPSRTGISPIFDEEEIKAMEKRCSNEVVSGKEKMDALISESEEEVDYTDGSHTALSLSKRRKEQKSKVKKARRKYGDMFPEPSALAPRYDHWTDCVPMSPSTSRGVTRSQSLETDRSSKRTRIQGIREARHDRQRTGLPRETVTYDHLSMDQLEKKVIACSILMKQWRELSSASGDTIFEEQTRSMDHCLHAMEAEYTRRLEVEADNFGGEAPDDGFE